MRKSLCLLVVLLSSLTATQCLSQSKQTAANPKATVQTPVSPHAEWAQFWDQMIGIDADGFGKAGLNSLSKDQAGSLFNQIYQNRPTLSCQKFYSQKEKGELSFVHLHVSGPESAGEFVGRLRSKLGAIKDVKLVASDDDADLVVSVLAFSDEVGSRQVGYIASVIVMTPCTYNVPSGMDKGSDTFRRMNDHFLQTNPREDELAVTISNTLDASSFDFTRNQHKNLLKFYDSLKN